MLSLRKQTIAAAAVLLQSNLAGAASKNPAEVATEVIPTAAAGPIAGGGVLWLSIVVAAGLYLLLRRGRDRN